MACQGEKNHSHWSLLIPLCNTFQHTRIPQIWNIWIKVILAFYIQFYFFLPMSAVKPVESVPSFCCNIFMSYSLLYVYRLWSRGDIIRLITSIRLSVSHRSHAWTIIFWRVRMKCHHMWLYLIIKLTQNDISWAKVPWNGAFSLLLNNAKHDTIDQTKENPHRNAVYMQCSCRLPAV